MSIHKLAEALRQRQYEQAVIPKETIAALSDKQIILSYLTCSDSDCGRQEIPYEKVEQYVGAFQTADDFLDYLDSVARAKAIRDAGIRKLEHEKHVN